MINYAKMKNKDEFQKYKLFTDTNNKYSYKQRANIMQVINKNELKALNFDPMKYKRKLLNIQNTKKELAQNKEIQKITYTKKDPFRFFGPYNRSIICGGGFCKRLCNKNYNLKAVVCRYGPNNYFADVKINSNFYRFMDCLKGIDVKKLNNINELSEYEPQLLFYEIEYPNKALITNEEIDEKLLSNLSETMSINLNLMNNMSSSSSIHDSLNYVINFTLKFIVRPQIWDQKEESALVINVQVSNDLTLEETINRFFKKLKKPKEAIINFTFKDNQLDENSKQKLEELNINKYSVIYALKNFLLSFPLQ